MLEPFDSSTVITPASPTFSMASAINSPTSLFWAEIVATWIFSSLLEIFLANLAISSTKALVAFSKPPLNTIALVPAEIFFKPSLTTALASTTAVVVPSPAKSLVLDAASFTICAPIFSNLSSRSISLAIVTPSFTT